jgi:ATP-dependent helicase/DNAse subunit B
MEPMPITLITGPANSGKARAVLEALREHAARGESPLLVVPTHADVQRYGRELARDGIAADARVEHFEGLLADVLRAAGEQPRSLGVLGRERTLAALAARSAAGRPTRGMTRALAAVVSELEVERVDPPRLREALDAWAQAEPEQATRACWLGDLYADYRQALQQLARADPDGRVARALDALRREPARWGGAPILLYGFDDFTKPQLDTIETLGVLVDAPLTVSLAFERGRAACAGRAGTFQTLLPLAREHRELAARAEYYAPGARRALHHLERALFEDARTGAVPAGGAVRLLEGGGERAELELVAEEIATLLRRGLAPAEIAVAHRSPSAIAELLGEVFRAQGIPYVLERRVRFADTALGRALLGLLAVACEQDAALGDLLAWLRAAPSEQADLADELELRALRAGVSSAAHARELWEAACRPAEPLECIDRLRAAAQQRSAAGAQGLVELTLQELERLAAAPAAAPLEPGAGLVEEQALRAGRAVLGRLRELAPVLGADAVGLIAALRALEVGFDEQRPSLAPSAVAVLSPLALRARRVRALCICGLQEGVFPAPAPPRPLLSEDERRRLAESSGLLALVDRAGPTDALAAERYLFYAAVSRPAELLVLSWHAADDDGIAYTRSLFVDDVCELFADELLGARRRRALGEVAEEIGELDEAGMELATWAGPAGAGAGQALATGTAQTIAPLRDARVVADLRERRLWSASGLEAWAGCPVRWFVERLLRARDLKPEPEPLARGGLAHAVLHDVLDGLRRETGSARPRTAELARARRLLRTALARHEPRFPLSVAPERVPGVRRRLEADLTRYLEHLAAAESSLEPTYLELSFGFPEEPDGLAALELGDGVSVRGRIDRVDVAADGRSAVVYDYKSSRAPDAGRWARERALQVALYMRAVEQSPPALHAVGGFYQPLSGRDLRPRGALDRDAPVELDCVRGDARDADELGQLVQDAVAIAREAAAQARAGALQARPDTCGFGGRGCSYPTICRCER